MKYKAKNKSLGKIKFILTVLVLSGGLLVGTKLVATNQENRSNAAFVADDGGGGVAPNYVVGTALSFMYQTHMCKDILRGKCADFGKVYSAGTYCRVGTLYGKIRDGFCGGGYFVKCCARVY